MEKRAYIVQELGQSGGGGGFGLVPERYIYKKLADADPAFDVSLPLMDYLSVDLELLGSSSEAELTKFRSALTNWGCFEIVNHGISSSSLDEMREATKLLFELPVEEKQRYAKRVGHIEGFVNGTFLSETKVHDWIDRFHLITLPVHKRSVEFWPERPDTFREKMHEYAVKVREILEILLKAAARSLGVDDKSFVGQIGENGSIVARFNMYPRCPLPDRVLGFHAHTDGSVITVVLQDKQVEALQVLKDGQWFRVPVNPDALFINVGDQLEMMSNGIFKSLTHRVVTSAENERRSLAMFSLPDRDNEIKAPKELITEDRPQMYQAVTNYASKFMNLYKVGRTPLSEMRV